VGLEELSTMKSMRINASVNMMIANPAKRQYLSFRLQQSSIQVFNYDFWINDTLAHGLWLQIIRKTRFEIFKEVETEREAAEKTTLLPLESC
jgi:hypothetical protein